MGVSVEEKKTEQKELPKICPLVSTMEMAVLRNKLDNTVKNYPKFVPMGCLTSACMFYKEEVKQCIFIMQNAILSSMAVKILNVDKKGE